MFLRCCVTVVVMMVSSSLPAQGLKISTHVFEVTRTDSPGPDRIISSSLSLCHNGRVYDSIDAADEVVIFDPVERRFTILNRSRGLATTLSFDEIRQLLETRQPKTDEYIRELTASRRPSAERIVESIRFQLNPKFSETFDPMKGTLILSSRSLTYRVETRKWNDPQQVERYLACTDWTAKLNSIMHPSSLFPEPRMALNESLRKLRDRMPVSVELDLRPDEQFRLRAEHQLTQNLSDDDHARIARWDESVTSGDMKQVSFRTYQQAVLVSQSR